MTSKSTLACPNPECQQLISVPSDKGELLVRCPKCGRKWRWNPPAEDKCELQFRCAKTGGTFDVSFRRENAKQKYRIVRVHPPSQAGGRADTKDAPVTTAGLGRKLLNYFQPAKAAPPPISLAERTKKNFNAEEFDFSGWFCSCCGHSRAVPVPPDFVQCSTCNECVCGARVREIATDVKTFQCHDGCGGGGRLGGFIENYNGTKEKDLPPVPKSLPSTSGRVPTLPPRAESQSQKPPQKLPDAKRTALPGKRPPRNDGPPLLGE